ncbi:MAG: histidine kinase [Prolixibacteraceae bacterium]|nr:histidine kinase [Prolixibacteraceae bacterium]
MQQSIFPFIFSLLLTQRLIRFSKINDHQQWVKWFSYAKFFSIFLFIAGFALSNSFSTQWIWNIFLFSCLLFALRQNEMRPLRMFLMAFVPYVVVALINNLTAFIAKDFYNRMNPYFDTALMLSVIWLAAILFSQHRQNKAAEKERIQRQKEDEINRAIAIRKVELEGLVAERTAELTHQKEELEHTLDELRATQAQLIQSEKMASLGELTAGIAHEIQNPLNFVNNFSEINSELIDEMKDELAAGSLQSAAEIADDIKQNLEKINHHGKRAEAIVKGMLQHSRSSTGKKELTDINALADEYLRLAYHGLRAKDKSFNATMKTDFDETLGKINVIPQDIGRVILNLITNAFYAVQVETRHALSLQQTPHKQPDYNPTVIVSTKKMGDHVKITVEDNGNGIPQAAMDKIFQPFFTTKPAGQGTGLGLSMSYEIVTKGHGGELKVENNPGGGAKFTIVLPLLAHKK